MEEQVKNEEVIVEVKEKKKISKKVLAIGGTILGALGIGALVLLTRGKKNEDNVNLSAEPVDVSYSEDTNSEIVE